MSRCCIDVMNRDDIILQFSLRMGLSPEQRTTILPVDAVHKDKLPFPQWEEITGTMKERWWNADKVWMYVCVCVCVRESSDRESVFARLQKIRERISVPAMRPICYQTTVCRPLTPNDSVVKIPFMDQPIHTFLTLIFSSFGSLAERKTNKQLLCHLCEIISKCSHGATETPLRSVGCLFHMSVFGFLVMRPIFKGTQQVRECYWQSRSLSGWP